MKNNLKLICAGCQTRYPISQTVVYRKKRCCGKDDCYKEIDRKVTHFNYKKQRKKMEAGKFRHGVPTELREYVRSRDNMICQMCKTFLESSVLQVHHIIPVSDGGTDDKKNLILLCYHCHTKVHQDGCDKYAEQFMKYTDFAESVTQ